MDEKYTYNGQEYSRADLEAKYGDKVDDAISKFGFELVQTSDKSDSDKEQTYTYDGVDYTESQLNDKYGDKVNQAIEKFGIKKKDSTQPVQTQPAQTQDAPLLGLGAVSEQATASPSVGQGVLKDVDQTQTTDGELYAVKKSIDRPLMAAQDRAKQESQSGSSLNLSRTEKFVPYDISEPEITIDEEAEDYIPDEFGAYSTSYEESVKDKSLLAQSEVKKQAQKRALKQEIKVAQLTSVGVKYKLFDKDYTDSLLDTYAPKDIKTTTTGSYQPGRITTAEETVRDQEKVDEYQVALNAAKKVVVSEKLSNIMDSGDTAFQSAELNIDKAMNSWLETAKDLETKEGRKDLTFIEDLILDDEYIKKGADISTVHDILKPGYVGGAQGIFDSEIDKFVEENLEDLSIESDEEKKMMKVHLKESYKSKKKLDKAAGEVAKELGYDEDKVIKDFDKIGEKIKGYESEIQSLYTPYEVKAKQAQKDMVLEFEQSQDRIFNRISQSEEYSKLHSELQGKVNSGEMTEEEANSALTQRTNIMISESPEATQLQKKYQGVLSSYESQFEKETSRIFSNIQSTIEQAKDLSSKEKEYRKMLSEKVSEMYDDEKAEIESDWKNLYFGGGQARGLKTGLGTIASMMSGGSEMFFGETEFSKSLTSVNNQIQSDNPLIDPGEFSWTESPFDADWWATRVMPSAPITFSLLVPGMGVGAATAGVATRIGLTGLSRALIAGTVSGTGMRAMESFTESSLQYYDLIERGESVEYASVEASKNYTDQMGAVVFDIAEMTFIFLPVASRLAAVGKFVVQVPLNSVEELYQEEIPAEEIARKRYLEGKLTQEEIDAGVTEYEKVFSGGKFSDMYNFAKTKQGQEVMAIGGIYGGAFGVTSAFGVPGVTDGDFQRANSQRKLNNFLNEEIVKYSSTETFKNAEGKPLEFGMGGVVRGPAETMQEAKNRRIWQLKATLDEMQMKGLVSEEDTKLGKKHIDFAFGVADQMPVNLPLVTRGQLLQKLTEIEELEQGLEGMTNETLIGNQKKKIAKLKKESEEIIGGTAKGYFINNASVTFDQFKRIVTNPKFAEDVVNGNVNVVIMNDNDSQQEFSDLVKEYKTEPRVFDAATDERYAVVNEGKGKGDRVLTKKEYDDYVVSKAEETAYADEAAPVEERQVSVSKGDKIQFSSDGEVFDGVVTRQTEDGVYIENDVSGEETLIPTNKVIATADMGIVAGDSVFIETEGGPVLGEVKSVTDTEVEINNPDVPGQTMTVNRDNVRKIKEGDEVQYNVEGEAETFRVKRVEGDVVVVENPDVPGSEISLSAEEVTLKDPFKRTEDDTQTTEQEGVGTEEQVGEERAGQVQEPEVSQEEGATDPVLQEQEKVADATEEIVQGIKLKVNQSKDDAKTKRRKRKALEAVSNILKFKANILPDAKVKVHETDESYKAATGLEGPGVYATGTNTIHVNLAHEDAGDVTVYHEMIHPIIYSAVKNETEARILTQRMVEGLIRSSSENKPLVDKLKGWLKQYEASEQQEETISELFGILASEGKKLKTSLINQIKNYFNKMMRRYGQKDIFRAVSKDADVVKVMNRISEAMQAGEAITAEDLRSGEFEIKTGVEREDSASMKQRLSSKEKISDNVGGLNNSISNAIKFASESSYANNLDFKNALQDRFKEDQKEIRKKYGVKSFTEISRTGENKPLKDYLVDAYINETLIALQAYPDALGWYDAKTKAAMSVMSLIHPELSTNKDSESAFKIVLAITSNGNKVFDNFKEANRQYEYFKNNGKFDEKKSIGIQSSGIKSSLKLVNNVLDIMPMSDFSKFLNEKFTVSDLKYKDSKGKTKNLLSGFLAKTEVYGASIFGAKIGNGFYMNLNGVFDQLTMDRWFIRQYGRLTGTLIDRSSTKVNNGKIRVKDSISKLSNEEKKTLRSLIPGYSSMSMIDLANSIEKVSAKTDKREILSEGNLNELRKAGNSLAKDNRGEIEAPKGGSQRTFIIDIFDSVQDRLKNDFGIDITIADLQAVNWYPEKGLYKTFQEGAKESSGKEDVSDNEQPDYETAAIRLAKELGVKESEIKKELDETRKRESDIESVRESVRSGAKELGRTDSKDVKNGVEEIKQSILDVKAAMLPAKKTGKQRKASPEKFVSELEKTKSSDPTQYWSVDSVSLSDAKKGKVISVDGGYGFVSNDGDIKGVFKLPTSKVKGVADKVLQESVKQGGTKLDNFDGYLTKIYERNGFRIAARIPFNEEFSPDGWNKAKHGTPDVVAMVYDPNNKLGIKEKKFDDYDAGIAYRDSFLEGKAPAAKKPGVKERKATYVSPSEIAVSKIDLQPSKPDVWAKKIAEAGGRGAAQELEAIGFTDYLNEWMKENKAKSVPKEVAEQYIKDNQIEIVDVTKDDKSPESLEQKKIQKDIIEKRDKLAEEIDSIPDSIGDIKLERNILTKESTRLITSSSSRDFIAQQESKKEREKIQKKIDKLDAKIDKLDERRREINKEWDDLDEQLADSRRIYRASDQVGDLRATKYKIYVLNGGKNYREVLMTLPSKGLAPEYLVDRINKAIQDGDPKAEKIARMDLDSWTKRNEDYRTIHWSEKNILAHVRMNERVLPNGERVLFIEEIQSDWAQAGKKRGFNTPGNRLKLTELENKKFQEALNVSESYRLLNKKTDGNLSLDLFNALEQQATENIDNKYFSEESRKERFLRDLEKTFNYWEGYRHNIPTMSAKEWDNFYDVYINELKNNSKKQSGYGVSYRLASIENKISPIQSQINDIKNSMDVGVSDMPYKKTDQWVGMAIRRAIKMAADEGIDRIAWVTGQQSADRYKLSQSVDSVEVSGISKKTSVVEINLNNRSQLTLNVDRGTGLIRNQDTSGTFGENYDGKNLEEVIGKALSEKILKEDKRTKFEGTSLDIGGEGMKYFYNTIVPKVAKQEAKRLDKNAKVEVVDFTPATDSKGIDLSTELAKKEAGKQLSIAITPKMVEAIETGVMKFRKAQKPSAPDQKVRASIDFQNRYGRYFTITKVFNNTRHLNNYIAATERKGNKEIGTSTFPIGLKERKGKPTGKIDWTRSPEGKGDPAITKRNEAVQESSQKLKEGKVTNEEYRQVVLDNSPIAPITTFYEPATDAEMSNALDSRQVEKLNSPIKENQEVGLRLDIKAYLNQNTWVGSVHEGHTKSGKPISYRNVARITNVEFKIEPGQTKGALNISGGKSKQTIARMYGNWKNFEGATTEEQAENAKKMVEDIWKSDEWVQVGMNPFRHSYFYDRSKNIGTPVVSADEVIQIGGLVYAKNVKYASPDADIFIVPNLTDKEGKPVKFRKPKVKAPLERAIDKNAQKAKDIKSISSRTKLKNTRKNFIDFRGDIKDLTKNQKELQGVYERIITSLGSNGVAKLSFDKAYDKIYDGLGPKKRAALDKIIIARRIIAINENRGVNNVDAIDNLFKNVPEFFTEKGGDYVTSFQQTMAELSDTISNSPLEKDMIIDEAEKLMSIMPVMYSGIEKSKQERIIKELNKAVEAALKAENITFSDEQGNKLGLNAAYELLDAKRDELGDDVYDQVNERADKYFEKFQEMLDQDLSEGIISQEQYNAMNGIEYSPRVFVQLIYGIDNEIINNTSEVDNVNGMLTSAFGMNKDAIRTLRDGVRNDDLGAVFFEMITNSEVTLGNYINSRERLRKMNDLNSYTLGQLVDLEQKFNDLKSEPKLTKEERLEFETLKETFDAFSIKRKKGYLPVNFYEEGVKKKFYIRGDLYSQWYNLRPDLSLKWKPLDKVLHSPIGILKTFATGVLSPLFGITASAMDLTQLMIFSDAKGFSEIMPVKASQIAKDLVGVPFFQKGVITSILQEDELFIEAVNEGIMMDFLYTQGNMNVVTSMLKTGIETTLEKGDLGFGGYIKSKKALLKIAEATLILNKMAELAPRLVAYQRTRDFEYAKIDKMVKEDALSKQEEDQMRKNARVKAAAIARELMNFAEGGEVTKGFIDRYSAYFNPAMQGAVTAARQYKENPIRTTSRMAQTSAMFNGMTIGLGVMLVAMLKDDDDDKEINEIIKETRDNASPYIKEKYFLIPTGKKDEDGNYTSIRLKKHPQMVPFYELFEIGYDNYLNGGDATAVVSKENALRINHAFFDNALPMNISPVDKDGNWRGKTILAEPFQRNPMLGGGLELITGYDIYRNKMIEPQTFNSKNADQAVKGLLNPYTEDFYKSFALEMQDATGASLSPAEYKHFVERMITNPRNNLYVAAGYALLNQASDIDVSKKDKSYFEDTYGMISRKLIYSSASKKGISKTKKSKFMDVYKSIDNKTYLIRESARKSAQEVTKEGGLMKIASDDERKGMLKEAFDKFKKNLEVVAETYPEMNMDPEVTANEYASYLLNKVVLEAVPADELNMRKYQEILSEPNGQYKYQKQALLFAHEFTKDGVMIDPKSEDFILILDQMDKTAKNSNKKFRSGDFVLEYIVLYDEENGTITRDDQTREKLNQSMKQYRMK